VLTLCGVPLPLKCSGEVGIEKRTSHRHKFSVAVAVAVAVAVLGTSQLTIHPHPLPSYSLPLHHRQLHRLSSALSLPPVTQLLHPSSRRPVSRADDASNLTKLKPLVREAFIATKIVAKVRTSTFSISLCEDIYTTLLYSTLSITDNHFPFPLPFPLHHRALSCL
jgi:hypothetical protein